MKVIVLKREINRIRSLSNSKEPLNLYGLIRENENLCYVYSIGKKHPYLPLIGQLRKNCFLPDNLRLIGFLQEEGLAFYYKRYNNWQKTGYCLVDLKDSFARTPFPDNLIAKLNKSCVVLFGLGSVGSRLADGLVRSGICHLKLIDPDTVAIENISRHECDLYDLERLKVKAVKEKILRINPLAKIDIFPFDVFQKDISVMEKVFQNVDLVIATTDRNAIQLKVNYECFNRKIPALFAGCYEEARGGEVLFVLPGETKICLECLRSGVKQPERLGEIDYSNALGPEDYRGEPGLNAAINLVTDVTQQYAIALLLRKEKCEMAKLIDPEKNLLLVGGALGDGYYFFKRSFHFINPVIKGPWKGCGTCQNECVGISANKIDSKMQQIR